MLEYNLGILALLSYNLLTAAKGVFLGSFLQKIDSFIVLSLCFGLVTIIFTVFNLIKKKSAQSIDAIPILKKHWPVVVGLNIAGVIAWIGYYYALKLIEPAIVMSLGAGIGPVITSIYYLIVRKKSQTSMIEWYFHAIIFGILCFLVIISYIGLSALGNIPSKAVILGSFAAIISGIAVAASTIFTKTLNNSGLKPRQIIPIRFLLLIIISAFFVPSSTWLSLDYTYTFIPIIMIAFAGIALPIYLLQVGIQRTNPTTVALTVAALPIFMLGCEIFDDRLDASIYSVLGAFTVAIIYMISLIIKSPPQIAIKKPKAVTEEI